MGSYLDGAGLTQVWGKLKDKIDAAKEVKSLTKAEYDALEEKEQNVIYSVTDGEGDSATTSIWLNDEQLNEKYKNIVFLPKQRYYTTEPHLYNPSGLYKDAACTQRLGYNDFDSNTLYLINCIISSQTGNKFFNQTSYLYFSVYYDETRGVDYIYINSNSSDDFIFADGLRVRPHIGTVNNNEVGIYYTDDARSTNLTADNMIPRMHDNGNITTTGIQFNKNNYVNIPHNTLAGTLYKITETYNTLMYGMLSITILKATTNNPSGIPVGEFLLSISPSGGSGSNSYINTNAVITQISGYMKESCPIGELIIESTGDYLLKVTKTISDNEHYQIIVGSIGDIVLTSKPTISSLSGSSILATFKFVNGIKYQIKKDIIFSTEKDYTDVNNLSLSDYNSLTTKNNKTFYVAEYYDPTEVPVPNVIQAQTVNEYKGLLSIISGDEDVIIKVQEEARPIQLKNIISSNNNKFTYTIDENDVITIHPNSEVEEAGSFQFTLSNSIGDCIDEIVVCSNAEPA